jgi:hypothetical protein
MNLKESVFSFFSVFSRLYPKEYQQKYSKDMRSVFLDMLEDSNDSGNRHAVGCLLREIACLPACLLREHFPVNGGDPMKSTRQVISATVLGFICFRFLLGIQEGTVLTIYNGSPVQPPEIILLQIILGGIFCGIFVGGAIGYVLSIRNKAAMMAVCGLAYMAPRFLMVPVALGNFIPWNDGVESFLLYATPPFYGFCFGMLAGLPWKGWKTGIVFGLAGALFSIIGFLGIRAAQTFVLEQGLYWIFDSKTSSATLWIFVYWLASNLLAGGIAGILWAILLDRLPRIKSVGLSEAG